MVTSEAVSPVATFRTSLHSCFGKPADALFELVDTVLTADAVPSFAHLSLEASLRSPRCSISSLGWTGRSS